MLKPSVLFIVNHAADYHESFYGLLAESTELTVLARNCESDNLIPPVKRGSYVYKEGDVLGNDVFFFQRKIIKEVLTDQYDFIVCVLNLRNLTISLGFFFWRAVKNNSSKWFWWGIIFGEKDNFIENVIRKSLLKRGDGVLVHSDKVRRSLSEKFFIQSKSYNNSNVRLSDFESPDQNWTPNRLKLLFVGTNKLRKNLDSLLILAERCNWLDFRCVGSGMAALSDQALKMGLENIYFFGHSTGSDLDSHFRWSNLVIAPGNVGLLASTASKYSKPVVYDRSSYHGPEVELLIQADQIALDFGDLDLVEQKLKWLLLNSEVVDELGRKMFSVGRNSFSVEHMVDVHLLAFGVS